MRYLLLIFLIYTTAATASVRYEMTYDDTSQVPLVTNTYETEAEAKAELLKNLEASKTFKGSWQDVQIEPIISKEFEEIDGETVTKYYKPENFSITLKDMTAEINAAALSAAIDAKLKCGEDAVKYIAGRNVTKGLTTAQIKEMASTYSLTNDLLRSGAIDTALEEIGAMTPDGIIVTPQDKTEILAYINNCN